MDDQTVVLPPLDVQRRYDVDVAASYLGISRAWLYSKIKSGDIAVIKDGRRSFIPGAEIARHCRAAA